MRLNVIIEGNDKKSFREIKRAVNSTPLKYIFKKVDHVPFSKVDDIVDSAKVSSGRWKGCIDANLLMDEYVPRNNQVYLIVLNKHLFGKDKFDKTSRSRYLLDGLGYMRLALVNCYKRHLKSVSVHELVHAIGVYSHCKRTKNPCVMDASSNTIKLCKKHLNDLQRKSKFRFTNDPEILESFINTPQLVNAKKRKRKK